MGTPPTISITVTPQTLRALQRAARLYEGIADEELKVYDQPNYRFHEPDRAIMRDTSEEFRRLAKEVKLKVEGIAS